MPYTVKVNNRIVFRVSIQLISPASGNFGKPSKEKLDASSCFHSINIPSEWEFPLGGKVRFY